MKQILTLFVIFLALSLPAQTTQKGMVKEYNEKAQKTPLTGVELNVRAANSTVSDKDGNFTLQFLSLKPGEKVNVRRIEKLGYEVFNREAIEQWNLNPSVPFVIVMCRSDRFKRIRDNYERVSSESYARQLKKDEAYLLKLKEQGKLKEAEYKMQLLELRENYDKQLDNLENYIDRFSRIDISELSTIEQEIIALVQEGQIEKAIDKYDEQNFVNKYTKEIEEIKEVSAAIDQLSDVKQSKEASKDSLLAAIDRQIETLRLAGGKDNFEKINHILHDIAYSDTTNIELIKKYYEFSHAQNDYKSAISCLNIIINARDREGVDDMSNAKRVVARRNLGEIYLEMDDYKNSEKYLLQSLELCTDSIWTDKYVPNTLYPYSEELLGRVYSKTRDYGKSGELLKKGLSRRQKNYDNEPDESNLFDLANIYNQIGNYFVEIQDFNQAYDNRMKAYDLLTHGEQINNKNYSESKSLLASDIGATCFYLNDIDGAIKYMTEAYDYRKKKAEENPTRYLPVLAQSQGNLGNLYSLVGKFDISHKYLMESYNTFKRLYDIDSVAYNRQYVMSLYNLASSFKEIEDNDNFMKYILQTKEHVEKLYESYPQAYIKFYVETLTGCGIAFHKTNQFDEELLILSKAEELLIPYYENEKTVYESCLLDLKSEIAQANVSLNNLGVAEEYFNQAISLGNNIEKRDANIFINNRFSPWLSYVYMLYKQNRYYDVIKVGYQALEKFETLGHPLLQNIYIRLIRSLSKTNQSKEAKELYEKASKLIIDLPPFEELDKIELI